MIHVNKIHIIGNDSNLGSVFSLRHVFDSIDHSLIGSVLENNLLIYHFCFELATFLLLNFFQEGKVEAYQWLLILVAPPLFGDNINRRVVYYSLILFLKS